MALALQAFDGWIADGHPADAKVSPLYAATVCPIRTELDHGRQVTIEAARCELALYRWVAADDGRMHALAGVLVARRDPALAAAVFRGMEHVTDRPAYLRFLRDAEAAPALWPIGADLLRESTFRPDGDLLEEARRWWRAVPAARGVALFWFARQAEGSYEPDKLWPELLQGTLADDAALASYLELGWPGFQLLPSAWPAFAKLGGRMRAIATAVRQLIGTDMRVEPGARDLPGVLAELARLACETSATQDVAALRELARGELAVHPGGGMSRVIEATTPAECKPRRKRAEGRPW